MGDGNCLPRCSSQFINRDQIYHLQIRTLIWQHIDQNSHLYQADYELARNDTRNNFEGTFSDWVEQNKNDGVYGDLVDIKGFSRLYSDVIDLITVVIIGENSIQSVVKVKNCVVLDESFDDSDILVEKKMKLRLK